MKDHYIACLCYSVASSVTVLTTVSYLKIINIETNEMLVIHLMF